MMLNSSLDASIIPGFELADMFSFTLDVFQKEFNLFLSGNMPPSSVMYIYDASPY